MLNSQAIRKELSDRFGLDFDVVVSEKPDDSTISIRAVDIPSPNGFSIDVKLGWRTLSISFNPDSFSSALLREMHKAGEDKRKTFAVFARAIIASGAKLQMLVDDSSISYEPSDWPATSWKKLSFQMEKVGIDFSSQSTEKILDIVTPFTGIVMSLLPLVEEEISLADGEAGLPEGAKTRVEVNKYERSRVNREACIAIYGASCQACGEDMGAKYGELGHGFVHVHHVTPVSKLGNGYIIDPSTDLIPVCPNCHAMLHQKDPPLAIEELRVITGYQP